MANDFLGRVYINGSTDQLMLTVLRPWNYDQITCNLARSDHILVNNVITDHNSN